MGREKINVDETGNLTMLSVVSDQHKQTDSLGACVHIASFSDSQRLLSNCAMRRERRRERFQSSLSSF